MHIGSLTVWELTVLVGVGSAIAGLLGSLTGLGGGVVLVPLLTLFFKVDIRYAIGASLVSVIATSSGAAAAYVKEGISNIRIGMFLEIATTLGAVLERSWRPGCRLPPLPSPSGLCCSTRPTSRLACASGRRATRYPIPWRRACD